MSSSNYIDLTNESDSSESDQESVIEDTAQTQLHLAIATVPEERLREIIARLVDEVPVVREALFNELVTAPPGASSRVIIPRWEICINCDEEFDTSEEREEGECCFHPGDMEPEYDRFEDWDEDVHGPIDTDRNRDEFPENFQWSCCDKDGAADGCVLQKHMSGPRAKRRRL